MASNMSVSFNATNIPKTASQMNAHKYHSSTGNGKGNHGAMFYMVPLLYCVVCLLIFITVLLLIILFKTYCKNCTVNKRDSSIEGGTFRMSDLSHNPDLENPTNNFVNDLNNSQSYNACCDDSSSTSSDSLSTPYEDKQNNNKEHYMSLKTSLQNPEYENVLDGKPTRTLNCENKKAKKSRDYVNIEEHTNMPLTQGRTSKCKRQQGDEEESQTSSESSSDESEEDSVNYTMVVFKETPNVVQREQ